MKQKITLEIDNDTGIEFDEQAELRVPLRGERYVYDGDIIECNGENIGTYPVLTPKIDHELEEARKKFPVGSWFTYRHDKKTIRKVERVYRHTHGVMTISSGLITISSGVIEHAESLCTPFPIPPCSYCTERAYCEKCGESFVYESSSDVLCDVCLKDTHSTNYYRVDKYFDDHLECTIAKGLTLEEANSLVKEQNKIHRAYVSFVVREDK